MGARIVTDRGMIFWPIRERLLRVGHGDTSNEPELWKQNLLKPIILCCVCMPSVWGLGIHYLLHGWVDIIYYPLEALSAAFINGVLWSVYVFVKDLDAKVLQTNKKYDE